MGNYAPNPNNQDIYNQLATISLNDVTAEQIDNLTNPVKLSSVNQDALITMDIVNRASKRTGVPMPNQGTIIQYTQTSDSTQAVIRPPPGEVWEIMNVSVANVPSVTGSNTYYSFFSSDATVASNPIPGATNDSWISSINNAGNVIAAESLFEEKFTPLYVTNTMFLRLYSTMDNVGTSAVVYWNVAYVRRY